MTEPKFGKYKIIIAGSRSFKNYSKLKSTMDKILANLLEGNIPIEIVVGGASGADTLGEKYANEVLGFTLGNGIRLFPAQWKVYGASAGIIRNQEMAEYATHLVAFWDGRSTGTSNMIHEARKAGLEVRIVNV